MKILIKPFAGVKDIIGCDEKELVVSDGITVGEVLERLLASYQDLEDSRESLLFAVNEVYTGKDRELRNGDILAIFPPVSGG